MYPRAILFLAISFSAPLCLSAQGRADHEITNPSAVEQYHMQRSDMLNRNTAKLTVSVQLDRTVYLPGELAEVTISVTNNTGAALEAFTPFMLSTGSIEVSELRTLDGQTGWHDLAPEKFCCEFGRKDDRPTYLFGAGQSFQKKMKSDEAHFDFDRFPLLRVPKQPGKYRISYTYAGHKPTEFEVTPALIRKLDCAHFATMGEYVSQSKQHLKVPRQANASVLESSGTYYVVLTHGVRENNACFPTLPESGDFTVLVGYLQPYFRLASSDKPIVSLHAIADKQENVTVSWTTSDGKTSSVMVPVDQLGPLRR